MTEDALRIAFAAFFTLGCMTIYEMRAHARAMTPALAFVAMGLTVMVALTGLAGLQSSQAGGPGAGLYASGTNAAASPGGALKAMPPKPAAKARAVRTGNRPQHEAAALASARADRARP